ncbi:hypothetical protein EGR_01792 [Echinococcus granulosus]|uniref:Uncharacterized protein n=1 Tax=Echinococcus granulosus TaxID=6210 RepID=W6URI1_ECHGR|nr:hypothetical protein EGR_01792 [Echinococcus granulosus]EUB63301.1 hypothetical protein EGR_01792 [Echinococcus granulosus]
MSRAELKFARIRFYSQIYLKQNNQKGVFKPTKTQQLNKIYDKISCRVIKIISIHSRVLLFPCINMIKSAFGVISGQFETQFIHSVHEDKLNSPFLSQEYRGFCFFVTRWFYSETEYFDLKFAEKRRPHERSMVETSNKHALSPVSKIGSVRKYPTQRSKANFTSLFCDKD